MDRKLSSVDRRAFLKASGVATGAVLMSNVSLAGAAGAATQPVAPAAHVAAVPLLLRDAVSAQDWPGRRAELLGTITRYLGEPTPFTPVEPRIRVLSESKESDYRQLKVAYEVEPGEEVRAYLLIPPAGRRRKNAAVLCLHGTSAEAKETQLGAGAKPGRDYGRLLATNGFVTLSPDHACSGERQPAGYKPYDSAPFYARHANWSMVGKAIWDGRRALDVLQQVDEVDGARLGAVGHSLGGHGAMFVAAFDERVKASVSSCGIGSWAGNNRLKSNWTREAWYVYLPHLRQIFREDRPLPFDLWHFAALAAPRAFLNISGMSDPTYGNNEALPAVGLQLQGLYTLLGNPAGFANFLFGAGHDVPRYSRGLTVGWFEAWLAEVAV
jgi:dienelactone hydrolase